MQIQTVFKAGNSNVVAIPKELSQELKIKTGQKVIVAKDASGEAIVIKKVEKGKVKKLSADQEFKRWWKAFLKDNSEILDELATR
jgi:antitoxin component of MazEF toxin-antitoxin module